MRFPAIQEMLAYWEALRGGRPVPLRSEVDPRGIERALEFAFILERMGPAATRFRLSGTHLNDLMGMDLRGMPLTALAVPEARDELARIAESVFAGPQIAEITLAGEVGIGRPPLAARLLILPMKSDGGSIDRALGCLVGDGAAGRTPRRFHITEVRVTRIARVARPVLAGGRAGPAGGVPAVAGLSEPAAEFAGPAGLPHGQPQARPAPRLRVVRSDD